MFLDKVRVHHGPGKLAFKLQDGVLNIYVGEEVAPAVLAIGAKEVTIPEGLSVWIVEDVTVSRQE